MPKPLPKHFKVTRSVWSYWGHHSVSVHGKELGIAGRRLFSFSREFHLRDTAGDTWGIVQRPYFSDHLAFFDCLGNPLIRLTGSLGWFGGTPTLRFLDEEDDHVVGKALVSEDIVGPGKTMVFVKNARGRAVAQLIQQRSWNSLETSVHLLADPDMLNSTIRNPRVSPVDPLLDMRILALYSILEFGDSTLSRWGSLLDLLLASVPLLAVAYLARWVLKNHPAVEDGSTAMLVERRNELLQKVQLIEDELSMQSKQQRALLHSSTLTCCPARPRESDRRKQWPSYVCA